MSQETSTVFASWGLMVGLNIAPPPPGPMTRNPPDRSAKTPVKHTPRTMRAGYGVSSVPEAVAQALTAVRATLRFLNCMLPGASGLESDSQPQTNGPLAEHAFLGKTICQLAKKRIEVGVGSCNRQHHTGVWIDPDVKVAQLCECTPAAPEVGIRRKQRVIENIVEIRSEGRNHALPYRKRLVNTQIHAPGAWSDKRISLGNGRIA